VVAAATSSGHSGGRIPHLPPQVLHAQGNEYILKGSELLDISPPPGFLTIDSLIDSLCVWPVNVLFSSDLGPIRACAFLVSDRQENGASNPKVEGLKHHGASLSTHSIPPLPTLPSPR